MKKIGFVVSLMLIHYAILGPYRSAYQQLDISTGSQRNKVHGAGIWNAIICYECNSAKDFHCIENVLPDNLKQNCSTRDRGGIKHTMCRKIVQHVDTLVNGQTVPSRVIRTCGWDDARYKGACYHRSGYGSRHEVCSCNSNFCNSSTSTAAQFITVLVLCITTKIFKS